MSLLQYQRIWDDGQPGWGKHSFNAAASAGHSASDISNFVNSGQIRIGKRAMDMAHGAGLTSRANEQLLAAQQQQFAAQAQNYQNQLSSYQNQLSDYSNRISSITDKYTAAQGQVGKLEASVADWTGKFNEKSQAYEAAKAQADAYKEEAVSRQLAGLRGGSTAGGTVGARGPLDLASGKSIYRTGGPKKNTIVEVKEEISPTDSVLARKGPVVERIAAVRRTNAPVQSQGPSAPTGATGSYYASRFA